MVRRRKTLGDRFSSGLANIVNVIWSIFDEPLVLLSVILALILYLVRGDDDEYALIHALAEALKTVPALTRFADWMVKNEHAVMGLVIMIPGALSVPRRYITITVIAAAVFVVFATKVTMYGFLMTSLSMRLFFRTNGFGRILVMCLIAGVVLYSNMKDGKTPSGISSGNSTTNSSG